MTAQCDCGRPLLPDGRCPMVAEAMDSRRALSPVDTGGRAIRRGDEELREKLAEVLRWHMTDADEMRGCALRCGYDGDDRAEHLADELLFVMRETSEVRS